MTLEKDSLGENSSQAANLLAMKISVFNWSRIPQMRPGKIKPRPSRERWSTRKWLHRPRSTGRVSREPVRDRRSLMIWLPAVAKEPSFDCRKARLPAEIQICLVPRLAELDSLIGIGYNFLRSTRGRQYADAVGIQFWSCRNECHSDQHRIESVQIEAIEAYEAAGATISLPDWVGKKTSNDSEEPTQKGVDESGVKFCNLVVHGITAIDGECYVEVTYDDYSPDKG